MITTPPPTAPTKKPRVRVVSEDEKRAERSGRDTRREERPAGLPVSAIAPEPYGRLMATRMAWLDGYLAEVKARG